MSTLRTPLEVALGHPLPLDMSDLDLGDYEAQDQTDAAREAARQVAAIEMGEHLYYEAAMIDDPRDPDGGEWGW